MKPVIQEEDTGCGIASIANILGKSYKEISKVASEIGTYAADKSLRSNTNYARRLLTHCGVATSEMEKFFISWENLPDLALLPIKHHRIDGINYWHWVVFKRGNNYAYIRFCEILEFKY
jgi:ABC-type bacteriocin/lantibiotic exporter with double-glycine peptidase domain